MKKQIERWMDRVRKQKHGNGNQARKKEGDEGARMKRLRWYEWEYRGQWNREKGRGRMTTEESNRAKQGKR